MVHVLVALEKTRFLQNMIATFAFSSPGVPIKTIPMFSRSYISRICSNAAVFEAPLH
jgi:hypothetical protein